MEHSEQEIQAAEDLVAERCEAAIDRFLDVAYANPGRAVNWGSNIDPWSFRVTYLNGNWILDDIELEIDGVEDLFEGEDLTSREGVGHVVASVMVPLAMEAALGEVSDRTAEHFLQEMEIRLALIE